MAQKETNDPSSSILLANSADILENYTSEELEAAILTLRKAKVRAQQREKEERRRQEEEAQIHFILPPRFSVLPRFLPWRRYPARHTSGDFAWLFSAPPGTYAESAGKYPWLRSHYERPPDDDNPDWDLLGTWPEARF